MRKLHKASRIRLVSSMRSNEVSLSFSNQVSYSCLRDCRNLFLLCWDEEEMCAGTQSPSLSLLMLLQLRTSKGVLFAKLCRWSRKKRQQEPPRVQTRTLNVKILYFAELFWRRKKTLKSEQDLNLGLLNSSQMLLPTESLELWHWRKGKMVHIHRHSSNLRLDLFVKALLCMVSVKTLTILRLRCFLHQTGYQLPLCMCSHIKYVWLTPKR